MTSTRPIAVRLIAGFVLLGAIPIWPFYLMFSCSLLAAIALVWTGAGRLPGDPLTTWVPCLIINGF